MGRMGVRSHSLYSAILSFSLIPNSCLRHSGWSSSSPSGQSFTPSHLKHKTRNPFQNRTFFHRHWWSQDSRTHQLHNETHVLKSLQVAPVQLKRQVGIFVVGVMGCGSGTLLGSGSGTLGLEESEPERLYQNTVSACDIFQKRSLRESWERWMVGRAFLPCQSRTSNNNHVLSQN